MKITVRADKVDFTLPLPMALVSIIGPLVIRYIPSEKLPAETKALVLESFPEIIKSLKKYKGMILVDVETAKGERVLVKI